MEQLDIRQLIGEATEYDKKQALEVKKPKSWCKSVSAFANGIGGKLVWGIEGVYVSNEGYKDGLDPTFSTPWDSFVLTLPKFNVDVDLDYFVWDNSLSTAEPRRIEITKEQYELIQKDSFHYLRIEPKLSYRTVEENGRYYLESAACIPADPMPDKETILERMDNFFAWLKDKNIQPAAIDICRSRISGYLPRTVFPWIEEEFLERLGRLYAIEIKARPQ